jgi:hypothetical protein
MVLLIAYIGLKCILVKIREDNWQCENYQHKKYYLLCFTYSPCSEKGELFGNLFD